MFFFFLSHIVFWIFFWWIGLWYVGFIPLLFLISLGTVGVNISHKKQRIKDFLYQEGIFFAWLCMMFGLYLMMYMLGIGYLISLLFLFCLNVLARRASYFFDYDDGKNIFHQTFLIVYSMLIMLIFWESPYRQTIRDIMFLTIALFTGIYGFTGFVLHNFFVFPLTAQYISLLGSVLVVMILLHKLFTSVEVGIFASQIFVTGVYFLLYRLRGYSMYITKPVTVDVHYILQGGKINAHKKPQRIQFFLDLYHFCEDFPLWMKNALSVLGVIVLGIFLLYFVTYGTYESTNITFLVYVFSIILFLVQYLLLKKAQFPYLLHRFFGFFVIHYLWFLGLFITGILYDTSTIFLSFGWIIASYIVLLYMLSSKKSFFSLRDYIVWMISNGMSFVYVVFLLFQTDMNRGLAWSLILFVFGIQIFFLFHSMKKIHTQKDLQDFLQTSSML